MTDWKQWDRTAARLQAIEYRCNEIKRYCGELQDLLEVLKERPKFETTAHDSMKKAESDLGVLYAFMKAANEHYRKLPETA